MKYIIETWPISRLIDLYNSKRLNLNPPYQRNPVWTKKAQLALIDSIKLGFPLPSFFIHKKNDDEYEMVDGQQRTRTLLSFLNTTELDTDLDDKRFKSSPDFLNYELGIHIITYIRPSEYIEEFYYRVNSSGLRLNRPERLKANYFKTKFLDLVEKLSISEQFASLKIIPENSKKRMLDRDLVEEIAALLIYGITEKKNKVDEIYKTDIAPQDARKADLAFEKVMSVLKVLDSHYPLSTTRYRQRSDFYTLCGFINTTPATDETYLEFYKVLLAAEKGIRPEKGACKPFYEYALNCVSQSNSAKARKERLSILKDLLANTDENPSDVQLNVISYYDVPQESLIHREDYQTFDHNILLERIILKEGAKEEGEEDLGISSLEYTE